MPPTTENHPLIRCMGPDSSKQPVAEGERIVISGISGLYAQANNVKEFSDILYNKENPITLQQTRWDFKHPELPEYLGVAPGIDRFDAQFFTVYHRLGHAMDPMSRKILEQTYQAIYDAGLSPGHLNGKKVGVFVGSSFSDTEKSGFFDAGSRMGLGIIGSSKTMYANRISYWLNIKGPSISIDEDDCSASRALEQACLAIRRGECESAIVGATHLVLHYHPLIHHGRLGLVSKDGTTKSFAENANGFSLSDSISVFLLQKSKDALRVYAEVVHVKNEFLSVLSDETGPKYGHYRNAQIVADFVKEFYKETPVTPQDVEYVEGYGTAVPEADKSELEAIEKVYCEDRAHPLLVGSVSSNVGLTQSAAGMTAITKILLGYRNGKLAANLNCENPRKDIKALRDGRMRIVNEHQEFGRTYTAVNGISVTGVSSHVLMNGHYKPKDLSRYKSSIPHLVPLSGRQETSVNKVFDILKSHPVDPEELALIYNVHSRNISGHLGRGYIILESDADNNTLSLCEKAEYFDDAKRPLWFVYSGMGSQWAGMGAQLMRIPIFASAIERCDRVLKPKGLDIVHIITTEDKKIFDNILHSFVGIAAIQIGLTDILTEVGLVPDGIIGHSVGELGCAYADGCMTAEEMILAAYSRGLVSIQTPLIRGSMAAVGLGYDQISSMCPPEIDVACRNSSESSTISGPADIMRQFVAELTAKQIFAKEVQCSNIAYHSRYIANAGPNLLKYLKEVIKDPKPRNKRWVSTSVSQDKWDEASAKLCSAEYHTNNLLNPVLFETTLRLIPSNAVLVEVAPHGLLQAILKRAMPGSCLHVPLTRRGHPDNALFLLQALGEIYMGGYTLKLQNLYPKIQFPVSTETPMLSHHVEWIHSEKWTVALFARENRKKAATCRFVKSIHDDDYSYLRGHVVREKMCYPFAAALVAVWDTFAMSAGFPKREVSVKYQDLHFYVQPSLLDQQSLKLNVSINRGTGLFEIISDCSRVMTGYITATKEKKTDFVQPHIESNININDMELTSEDIYQLFNDKDYNYDGEFRSIECSNITLNEAAILWRNNWVTFLDGLIQLNTLRQPHQSFSQPTFIRKILIDVKEHLNNHAVDLQGKTVMKAAVSDIYDYTSCGGVVIQNIKFKNYPPLARDLLLKLYVPPSELGNVNKKNKLQDVKSRNETLQSAKFGNLDGLHWVASPHLEQSNLIVTVHYAGLNVLDVKRATGVTSYDSNSFGMDFSGTTRSGERVMGIIKSGAASTYVNAQQELLWPVPKNWSLEDAATVPYAYLHAFYALKIKGRMEPGMRVLVHGGVGALGQAAIAIALAHKCQVFATVSNNRKKKLLQKLFPQLKDEHIGNSRDISFSDYLILATKGRGCEIVISSAKGEFKDLCLKCCGLNGVLVDPAQIQNRENFGYGMYHMTRQRSYLPIDFSSVFTQSNHEELKILRNMMTEGVAAGYVVPLTRITYARNDVSRAFRLLETSKHCGRVLLRMCETALKVEQRLICDPDKCQVIFWDNDSIGVHLVNRLVDRGARKLYICCKTITTYLHLKMRTWQQQGVKLVVSVEDVNSDDIQALNDANRLGAVEGIYVVITKADSKTSTEDLTTVLNNLDSKSRSLCHQLRHFIVASTTKTSAQQMCSSRAKSGFPATHLDLRSISQDQAISSYDIAEIIERALCCPHVVLLARAKRIQPLPILEQIATVTDIIIPKNVGKDVTLQELGVTDDKAQTIGSVLNETYNISLDEAIIPLLTIEKVNDLQKSVMDITPTKVRGLDTFFSNTGTDELLGTADIIVLPTLFRDVISLENDYEIEERYLCIVPGMEGHHERFRVLCERLKLPALVLQPGLDHPHETVQETAQRYAEILNKKTKVLSKFYILGYESGVAVALELASILEKQGSIGTVYCLGYTPEELQVELEEQLSDLVTKEQLQDAIIRHMYKLHVNEDTVIIDKALQHAVSWEVKKDAYVRCTMGRVEHSVQYIRGLLEATLARFEQVRCYNSKTYSLRSQLVLLRAASKHVPLEQFSLQRHSQQPIIVHQLQSDLSSVLNDLQCPSLINRYLDAETQADFDKQNLCQSYMISTNGI